MANLRTRISTAGVHLLGSKAHFHSFAHDHPFVHVATGFILP